MEFLAVGKELFSVIAVAIAFPQDVTVALVPRCVVYLSDDELNLPSGLIEDVKQVEWAHEVAKVAQLCQESDRSSSDLAGFVADQLSQLICQWKL